MKINSTFAARYPIKSSSSSFAFKNLITATPKRRISGHYATFTGFTNFQNATAVEETYSQIDFIFGGKCVVKQEGDRIDPVD